MLIIKCWQSDKYSQVGNGLIGFDWIDDSGLRLWMVLGRAWRPTVVVLAAIPGHFGLEPGQGRCPISPGRIFSIRLNFVTLVYFATGIGTVKHLKLWETELPISCLSIMLISYIYGHNLISPGREWFMSFFVMNFKILRSFGCLLTSRVFSIGSTCSFSASGGVPCYWKRKKERKKERGKCLIERKVIKENLASIPWDAALSKMNSCLVSRRTHFHTFDIWFFFSQNK